jgi:GrpB-like predicted nucleotidyltransferase (UPF0157 family)
VDVTKAKWSSLWNSRKTSFERAAPLSGPHWFRYLRFRNALRADPALRDAYASIKRSLAARYPRDREAYIAGKTEFVEGVLRVE